MSKPVDTKEGPFDPLAAQAEEFHETPEETSLAVHSAPMAVGVVSGEFSAATLRFPRLMIAHGVGALSEKGFAPGDLVLDKEYLLAHKDSPVSFICLAAQKFWREYLDQAARKSGMVPREYNTEAEVHAAGGTTEWVGKTGPTFACALRTRILIRKPKDLTCGLFGLKVGEHIYAPAEWSLDKQAYRRAGEPIVYASGLALRAVGGLLGGVFELRTSTDKSASTGNTFITPIVRLSGFTTEAERKELMDIFSTPTTA